MRLKVDLLPKSSYPDVVIVVDVLRATTTAPILLGVTDQLFVTPSLRSARAYAQEHGLLLAGEREGMPPEGFNYGASPAALRTLKLDRDVVLTTENGPRALEQVEGAKSVLLGSFYNARAVLEEAARRATEEIALVCAGQNGNETLEDTVCAGFLARRLEKMLPEVELRDSARLAMALLRAFPDPQEALVQSTAGKLLARLDLHEDLAVSSLISQTEVVPVLKDTLGGEGGKIYRFERA
ncbi:2-phosphosulfolactate phosphatase [Deinobacterium chartae]|uniref:Probable 2-phosphosulfolactate phosphatase n=1 Tax=Deinobacterium chartae TaxID=521158 RepID=A0A841I354_9DEIO|nr:2-phosphosulfolactate phosphatase [Deinobacterium chartae]MBB6098462.1 2-phosphosulfolactate phosphatase [Deinobacterium chartae]